MPYKYNPFSGEMDFYQAASSAGYPINYAVGHWTNFSKSAANVSTNAVAPNYYYGAPVEVLANVDISNVRVRIAATAVGAGILALYSYDGAQWVLVDQTAAFNTAVGGVLATTWSGGTLTLTPGVYCFCTSTNSGCSFETVITSLNSYFGILSTMAVAPLTLQLHPSAYTGTALAVMPLALGSFAFVPNIINLVV